MKDFDESTYGDRIAEVYDEMYANLNSPEQLASMVDMLAGLAGSGPAWNLESARAGSRFRWRRAGLRSTASTPPRPWSKSCGKSPAARQFPSPWATSWSFDLKDRYSLIYVVFNTFFAPLTQEDQVKCFMNVARHLNDGGFFVIEAFVPDVARFVGGQSIRTGMLTTNTASIDMAHHDAATQMVTSSHVYFTEDGVRLYPIKLRYAWPSELDLMGRLAGLTLRSRTSDWQGSPFTASSTNHVSVYERR